MSRFARCLSLAIVVTAFTAHADSQVGTLTRVDGQVTLLTRPSKIIEGEGPHVKWENDYYVYREAKAGDRLEHGNVLRTSPGAKARIVYENGDQYNVGDGSAFQVKWNRSPASAPNPEIRFLQGKVRAIISKDGPRNRLHIRTPSATMGVRGTDFFVASRDAGQTVEVAVIRGAVEVKPKAAEARPVKVEKGQTAAVAAPAGAAEDAAPATEAAPAVVVQKTTKQELAYIQLTSTVAENARRELASESKAEIEKLEKKAVETTLKDIKTHDPQLYAKLDTKSIDKVDEVNEAVVRKAVEVAPKAPESRKPFGEELDSGDDAYKTYFKE